MGSIDYNTRPGADQRFDLSPESEVLSVGAETEIKQDKHLDGDECRARLARVQSWFRQEIEWQADERVQRSLDHEYYDGHQWNSDDAAELEDRGQKAFVFNMIKESVDVLSGSQRQAKSDYRVLPREKNDRKAAEIKTKCMKYLADVNNQYIHRSAARKDQIISGLGWIDTGVRSDPTEEPIYYQYEDWRNCWYDHLAQGPDYMRTGRFVIRAKWADLDTAAAMFPERGGNLLLSAAMGTQSEHFGHGWSDDVFPFGGEDLDEYGYGVLGAELSGTDSTRNRVLLVECQYKLPFQDVKLLKGDGIGSLHNVIYDPDDPIDEVEALLMSGYASLVDAKKTVMRHMIFTGDYVLQDRISPFNHNRFSLCPLFAFRRKKTGEPYGLVRNLRDPQEDLNKRRSKALYHMSTNKVIADEDAVQDKDELYDEANRPDGMIFKRRGAELTIHNESAIGMEHVQLAEQDLKYIERASGITDEARGVQTNAVSGTAIQARQQYSQVATSEYRENALFFDQQVGQNQLSLLEQFWTDRKVVRLTGDEGGLEFMDVNEPEIAESDITASQADFVVDMTPFSATQRQAAAEAIGETIKNLPGEVQLVLLDIWAELSDLPVLSTVGAQRIRKVTGMDDPSADPDSEEAQAEEQAKQQAQQQQAALEQKMVELEMALKDADRALKEANAKKAMAQAQESPAKIDKMYAEIKEMFGQLKETQNQTRIKKAEALHKIETGERQHMGGSQ